MFMLIQSLKRSSALAAFSIKTAFVCLLLLLPAAAFAEQLTLSQCLTLAQKNNPYLKAARTDIDTARQTAKVVDSSIYPHINLQGGYTSQLEPQAMKVMGTTMENQQANYGFAGVAIDYLLYDFGKRTAGRQAASTAVDAVAKGVEQQEQDLLLEVIEIYYRILEGQQLVEAAQEELQTVAAHRKVAQALFDAGSVTRNDLLQAEVRLASSRQKLLGTKNQVQNLRLKLGFLTGLNIDESFQLEESAEDDSDFNTKTPDLTKRPDLQALQHTIEVAEQETKESRTAFYPELFTKFSLDYLQNNKLREQAIYAATIGLRFNLFDGFATTAAAQKALSKRTRAMQQYKAVGEQAQLEVQQAKNDLQVAREQIAVSHEAIRQGEENLRINRSRYEERVGTATDVLDAQTLLTLARTNYYSAVYQHKIAGARLQRALGITLN